MPNGRHSVGPDNSGYYDTPQYTHCADPAPEQEKCTPECRCAKAEKHTGDHECFYCWQTWNDDGKITKIRERIGWLYHERNKSLLDRVVEAARATQGKRDDETSSGRGHSYWWGDAFIE